MSQLPRRLLHVSILVWKTRDRLVIGRLVDSRARETLSSIFHVNCWKTTSLAASPRPIEKPGPGPAKALLESSIRRSDRLPGAVEDMLRCSG